MPTYKYTQYPYISLKDTDITVDNEQYELKIEQIELVRNEVHISGKLFDKQGNVQKPFYEKIILR